MGKIKHDVPIVLEWDENGEPLRERRLRYTLGALALFEDKHNMSLAEIFKKVTDEDGNVNIMTFRLSMLIDLVWVGLTADDPSVTYQEVGNMIDMDDMPDVLPLVLQAIGFSNKTEFPESPRKGQRQKPKK